MTIDSRQLDGMDAKRKRELLAQLLRERVSGSGEIFELSLGQEALLFLNELAPQAVPYNVALCGRIRAKIDVGRFEGALLKVLERHPMLRCTFALSAEGPRQRIGPVPVRCLEVIDASGCSEEELKARVRESYSRPFDLANGPAFRASLFTRTDTDHVLLITAHHIVFDAWSLGIILTDLATLYEKGSVASLSAQQGSYADFVKWQRRMLESEEGREAWNYWRSRLENFLTPTDLPADHIRPSVQTFRGGTYHFELPAALCAQLRGLARSDNATPYIVLATAFHALLHRYTGSPVVPIGTPLAGRSRQEFENIVGYFVNPVVLCARVESGTTFRQHLAEMRETAIGAQRYGDFPFPELVNRLQPARDTSRTPLFQVMLNLIKGTKVGLGAEPAQSQNNTLLHLGPLPVEDYPLAQQEGQFDLDLDVIDMGTAMPAILKYSTDLFEAETVQRMAGHFVTLLSAAVANPDLRIADLPLLTEAERKQVVVDWNATARTYPDMTLHRRIEEQVQRAPTSTALVFEGQAMSYGELNRRANQLARHLRGFGVGPDTLVGVCIERSFEMVVALLGILKAGGAYVPVDPGYPVDRQAYMIENSRTPVLLTQAKLAERWANSGARVIALDSGWEEIARQPEENLGDGGEPGNLAYVIYTSGSTGKPKGAMNEHRGVCNRLLWMQDTYQLTPSDRVLQKTPFSFDVSVWEFFWPLMTGARLVIARPEGHKDPAYLVRLIQEEGITTLHFVPSMLRVFLEAEGVAKCDSIKRVICSGEALPFELQERFFSLLNTELHNLYGPTEAAVDVTYWACERGSPRKLVPIGRPVANTQMYVLDAAAMNPMPIGVPGELYIGGVQVGRGYWGRPELTAERFVPDPFRPGGRLYRTGDLARWLPDGAIDYLGRNDFQVKVRGFRIELGEIEAALSEHASVAQAVVIAREETAGDVRLVAYVVARPQAVVDTAELRASLRSRLPDYMVPAAFMVLDALPLNPSGKVDRKALPAPANLHSSVAAVYEAPRNEVESAVAAIWEDVLHARKVGIRDDFFELGGHSLLAAQLLARIRTKLGVDLPVRLLFETRTVSALSEVVEAHLWREKVERQVVAVGGAEREEFEL